jgi:hypothetical protein
MESENFSQDVLVESKFCEIFMSERGEVGAQDADLFLVKLLHDIRSRG